MADDDRLLAEISAALDGEGPAPETLSGDGQRFRDDALALRRLARFQVAETPPDVTDVVRERIGLAGAPEPPPTTTPKPSRRRQPQGQWGLSWRWAIPVFAAAAVIGGVIAGAPRLGDDIAAADLLDDAIAAQAGVDAHAAVVTIEEYGWHPEVPVRSFSGTLDYRAPDALFLELEDRTDYPSIGLWPDNDVVRFTANGEAARSGRAGCPVDLRPDCLTTEPVNVGTVGRAPFASSALDLVVPIGGLGLDADAVLASDIDAADGVLTVVGSAAQMAPVLDALFSVGDWRSYAPGDRVELQLDEETYVLRGITVRAGIGEARDRWAVRTGQLDPPGSTLLEADFRPTSTPPPPSAGDWLARLAPAGTPVDAGFRDRSTVDVPAPGWLPEGMAAHRLGVFTGTDAQMRSFSDGRAWVTVTGVREWAETQLFGSAGPLVTAVETSAGVVYITPRGDAVAIHGVDAAGAPIDVEVRGSLAVDDLVQVATGLGVTGRPVPDSWVQGAVVSELPSGALRPPSISAARVDDGLVTIVVAGPGASAYEIVQQPGDVLAPPLGPDVTAVEIRGGPGRHDPQRHSIEWVEAGWRLLVEGAGLSLAELLTVADSLER